MKNPQIRLLSLLIVTVFLTSCNLQKSPEVNCAVLNDILERDQSYRIDMKIQPGIYIADSLYTQDHGIKIAANDLPTEYLNRAYRILQEHDISEFIDLAYADSMMVVMQQLDGQ